jgi:hypothetical protein
MPREQATADVAGMVKANMQALTTIQKELGDTIEEANRHWLARAKSEAELASDLMAKLAHLMAKLAHTQSIPDATAVYQEWLGHRMQRLAEDGQKCVADCQKLASTWTRLATNQNLKGIS